MDDKAVYSDKHDYGRDGQPARKNIDAVLARVVTEVVGPVLGEYVKELRWDIQKLTARLDAVEAENAALRNKIARARPIVSVSERIARIERQMQEAEDAAD
jgi:hypothetical protein